MKYPSIKPARTSDEVRSALAEADVPKELADAIAAVGSVRELADVFGVSVGTVYRWANRFRPIGSVAKIALQAIANHPEEFTNERKDESE